MYTVHACSNNYVLIYMYMYTVYIVYCCSIPGKRPPHGKHPGSHFRRMNGEHPLPGKYPGILSTVQNAKCPAYVSILYLFFTSFFGPSKIKSPRKSFPSKVSVPYSIASTVHYGARYMANRQQSIHAHTCAIYYYCNIDPTHFNFYTQ